MELLSGLFTNVLGFLGASAISAMALFGVAGSTTPVASVAPLDAESPAIEAKVLDRYVNFSAFSATSSAAEETFVLSAPAPATFMSAVFTETPTLDARFAGLLSHMHWLLREDGRVETSSNRSTVSREFIDKQVERTTDNLSDSIDSSVASIEAAVAADVALLGTDISDVDTRLLTAEATIANLQIAAASSSVLASNLTLNGHWLSGDGDDEGISVDSNGYVGIGTSTPAALLNVVGSGSNQILLDTYGGGATFRARRASGTVLAPTAVLGGNFLGSFVGAGYNSTAFADSARMVFAASGNWSPTNQGSLINFSNTPVNSTTMREVMRIESDGSLRLGDNPYLQSATPGANGLVVQGNVGIGTSTPTDKLIIQATAGQNPFTIASSSGAALLTVRENGGVGIGTSTVSANSTLTVEGRVSLAPIGNGASTLRHSETTGYLQVQGGTLSSSGAGMYLAGNDFLGVPTLGAGDVGFGLGTTTSRFRFQKAGAELLSILNSGNVGIGATNPTEQLQIGTNTNTGMSISLLGGHKAYMGTFVDHLTLAMNRNPVNGTFSSSTVAHAEINIKASADQSLIEFVTSPLSNTQGLARMVIDKNGLVGIGTTTPAELLEVANATLNSGNPTIRISGAANTNFTGTDGYVGSLEFYNANSANSGLAAAIVAGRGQSVVQSGELRFQTAASSSVLLDRMTITKEGNVGINTTATSKRLDVNGDVRIRGDLATLNFYRDSSPSDIAYIQYNQAANSFDVAANAKIFNINNGTSFANTFSITASGATVDIPLGRITQGGTANPNTFAAQLQVTSANNSYFSGAGNLGIGTTTPADKLTVVGDISASGQFLVADGSAASPSMAFANGTTTGFYRNATGLSIATAGAQRFTINSNGFISVNASGAQMSAAAASDTTPSLIPNRGDGTTGIGASALGALSLITAGANRIEVTNTGNVGVGTTTPDSKISVQGTTANVASFMRGNSAGNGQILLGNLDGFVRLGSSAGDFSINNSGNTATRFYVNTSGAVGIGTTTPAQKLHVDGGRVRVTDGDGSVYLDSYINGVEPTIRAATPSGHRLNIVTGSQTFTAMENMFGGGSYGGFYMTSADGRGFALRAQNDLAFSAGTSPIRMLVASSTGYIGIGTTSPASLLHVSADTNGANRFTLENYNSGSSVIAQTRFIAGPNVSADSDASYITRYNSGHATYPNQLVFSNPNSASDWNFITSATSRMYIDAGTGSVGIGTTTSASKLSIIGTSGSSNSIFTVASSTGTELFSVLSNGNARINNGNGLIFDGTSNPNLYNRGSFTTLTTLNGGGGLDFTSTGGTTSFMRILSSNGNVGIGTTSPGSKTHIYESTTNQGSSAGLTVEQAGTGDAIVQYLLSGAQRWTTGIDNSDLDKFKIGRGDNWSSGVDFTIDPSGNVGVGTSSPEAKFDVLGKIRSTGNSPIVAVETYDGTTDAEFFMRKTTQQTASIKAAGLGGGLIINSSSGSPTYRQIQLQIDGTARLFIQGDGNVGIGTTSPNAKLTISTTAAADGINIDTLVGTPSTSGRLFFSTATAGQGVAIYNTSGQLIFSTGATPLSTSGTERWRITSAGIFQSPGASTVQTATGDLTLATGGGNGSILLSPNGTGNVGIGTTTPTDKLQVFGGGVTSQSLNAIGAPSIYTATGGLISYYTSGVGSLRAYSNSAGTGSADLSIITGGSERVRVLSGGNVGIGTTTPASPLHVVGNVGSLDFIKIGSSATSQYSSIGFLNSVGAQMASFGYGGSSVGGGFADKMFFNSNGKDFVWGINGSGNIKMVLTSDGNVGIGTTTPDGKLNVSSAAHTNMYIDAGNSSLDQSTLFFRSINNWTTPASISSSWWNSPGMVFTTPRDIIGRGFAFNSNNGTTRLFIDSSTGNVGIGTTTPDSKLTITSISSTVGSGALGINDGANRAFALRMDAGGTRNLNIDYLTGGVWGTSLTVQRADGNVGIGTTTPTYKLDVAGVMRSSGLLVQNTSPTNHSNITVRANGTASGGYDRPYIDLLGADGTGVKLRVSGDGNNEFVIGSASGNPEPDDSYFRISGAGNVSIGTTTSSSKLTIGGDIRVAGVFRDSNNASGTAGMVLQTTGTGTQWVATSTLGIGGGGGSSTFLGLTDTPGSFTADRILFTNSGATALSDSADFTYNGTNLGLGADDGIAFNGLRYFTASTTLDNILIGENSGFSITTGTNNTALGNNTFGSTTVTNTGSFNVAIGDGALFSNTSGSNNTANGYNALYNARTTTHNTAVGDSALFKAVSFRNTAIGGNAGYSITSTDNTVAVGYNTFGSTTAASTGDLNVAVGAYALFDNTSGAQNTANGYYSLNANTQGANNTALGYFAGRSNTTGAANTALGASALYLNTTGSNNVAVGSNTLLSNTLGSNNVAIGNTAGYDLSTGAGTGANTFIGHNTGRGVVTGINNTILGANVTGLSSTLSNNIIIADGAGNQRINVDATGNVGIGTTTPSEKLTVVGTIQSTTLLGGSTNLTTDASGNIIRDPSDARLKENVTTIENALDTVLALRGVRYEWIDKERFGDQFEIGFIAQEVDSLVPEVVQKGGEYWSLNSKNLVAVVVEAMKEVWAAVQGHDERLTELEVENAALKARLDAVEAEIGTETPVSYPAEVPIEIVAEVPPAEVLPAEEVIEGGQIEETTDTEALTEPAPVEETTPTEEVVVVEPAPVEEVPVPTTSEPADTPAVPEGA